MTNSVETREVNGIVYERAIKASGLIVWCGGARGGDIDEYPSGMLFSRDISWVIGFEQAAELQQQVQKRKHTEAVEFLANWRNKT